ncbi:hypothetical protein FBU59_002763 [Linderina macrospora]|uniref:Uncharacterized protein n=1 Tax=Linderina macrospora TaxID=4868 RepID=A0ACC1JA53_9FUNG|nr:hypothetical protein FBU59_002763 [Linderina macrospora]
MDVPGAQHFIVRQHTQFPDVTEVFDCDDLSVVYRKVSHTDKQWLDTFHDVAVEDEDNGWPASSQSSSITATHLFPARTVSYEGSIVSQDSMGGGSPAPSISGCYSGVPSVASSNVASTMRSISCSPSLGSSIGSSVRSSWRRRRYPASYDQNPLWEISTPYPNRFPLHCRDARGVIDPVPLTLMVLDRHKFCYRFQLAGTKMRWVAKRLSNQQTELQCYVRNTIVAVMLFDCEWAAGEPQSRHLLPGELPLLKCQNVGPRGGCTPRIVIFPAAFQKLAKVEPGVVESFIVFSGIEVFECLFIL